MPTPYHPKSVKLNLDPKQQQQYRDLADLVEECVRYGSHVLEWSLTEDHQDDRTKLVFLALLRYAMDVADGMPENIRKGQIDANKATLRSLLDACFSMLYLVAAETPRRALTFMYMDEREMLKRLKRLLRDSQEHKEFAKAHENDRFLGEEVFDSVTEDTMSIKAKIVQYEAALQYLSYKEIDAEFNRMKQSKPKYWYSLFDGPKNIRELAKAVGMLATYDVFFKRYSGRVHPTDIIRGNISPTASGQLVVQPIRHSGNPIELVAIATQLMHTIFQAYIDSFIPSRSEELQKWHSKEIVKPFREINRQ